MDTWETSVRQKEAEEQKKAKWDAKLLHPSKIAPCGLKEFFIELNWKKWSFEVLESQLEWFRIVGKDRKIPAPDL